MTSVMQRIGDWFRAGRRRAELSQIDPAELERVAGELGVSVHELGDLAAEGPGRAEFLHRRLNILRVDAGDIARREPAVMRDMERVCSHCGDRGRCERDLDAGVAGADWQHYCPNAGTIAGFRKN
jgi:hypothetical protein